jgi:hypothetical protein
MPGDGSVRGSKESRVGPECGPSEDSGKVRLPLRPRRGIPALLDWIEEAEAVNRAAAARMLAAVLILLLLLLILARLGGAL